MNFGFSLLSKRLTYNLGFPRSKGVTLAILPMNFERQPEMKEIFVEITVCYYK